MNNEKNKEIDIAPSSNVYKHYRFRNYKIWKALAEYIDNSTQNYKNNGEELLKSNSNYVLKIEIFWDKNKITIVDNALGMDESDLRQAMVLGKTIKNEGGRNRFGMGLKTASCWFSNVWEIHTRKLNNDKEFFLKFDVNYISENNINKLKFDKIDPIENWHGTKIILKDLNKKITKNTIKTLKKLLSNTYKSDIESEKIKIYLNDEKIEYEEPELWNDKGQIYEEYFEFGFYFENQKIDISGFAKIALGSTSEYERGFGIFKNNRAIIVNYKNSQLVGKTSNLAYQRLYGEIHLKGVNVTQDKTNFDWENGLKEEIFNRLENKLLWIKTKANNLRKPSNEIKEKSEKEITNIEIETSKILNEGYPKIEIENIENIDAKKSEKFHIKKEIWKATYHYFPNEYDVILSYSKQKQDYPFIEYRCDKNEKNNFEVKIFINVNHGFYEPYHYEQLAAESLNKLISSFIISKIISLRSVDFENDKINKLFIEYHEKIQEVILNQLKVDK